MKFKQLLLLSIMGIFFVGLIWGSMGCEDKEEEEKKTIFSGFTKIPVPDGKGSIDNVGTRAGMKFTGPQSFKQGSASKGFYQTYDIKPGVYDILAYRRYTDRKYYKGTVRKEAKKGKNTSVDIIMKKPTLDGGYCYDGPSCGYY